MEEKDLKRELLLDEILRETAPQNAKPAKNNPRPTVRREESPVRFADKVPEEPPVRFADKVPEEPPVRFADKVPEELPVRFADKVPEEPPVRFADKASEEPPVRFADFDNEVAQQVFADDDFIAENAAPQISDVYMDEDLEGESQPAFRPSAHNTPHNNTAQTRKKRRPHRVLSAIIMLIVILSVSIGLSSFLIVYGRDLLGINSDSSTKIVTIPNGASMEEIAEILKENNIITRPDFFVTIVGMSDKDKEIKPGDHELRPDMAYETILEELINNPMNNAASVSVTFPEGIRLCDAADLLEENNVCAADAFLDYFNNDAKFGFAYESHLPSFQDDKFYRMEGYLFPDTYTFYEEMDVELVCQKILSNFNDKIKPEYYDRMAALNLTLDETITLASIIQAEAGNAEQMADISSVFWNRLNNASDFPVLQSDPTGKYVEEVIKPHSMSYNQALYDSYDTYKCTGLPAGPIDNPGADAIQAALYPSSTNYYYFYANIDTKKTYFAETLEEHNKNGEKIKKEQEAAKKTEAEESNGETE